MPRSGFFCFFIRKIPIRVISNPSKKVQEVRERICFSLSHLLRKSQSDMMSQEVRLSRRTNSLNGAINFSRPSNIRQHVPWNPLDVHAAMSTSHPEAAS